MKNVAKLLLALLLTFQVSPVSAAITSWDVSNLPIMFLETNMTNSTTTGIQLQAPERNRVTFTFPTTSGAVLRVYQGWKEEFIYYSSASVDSTTKIVTLSGVSRNLCISQFDNVVSCGNGYSFSRGAYVELSTASWLLNKKANKDRVNVFTGSGQITGTMTGQALIRLNAVTTTQRNAFTYGPNNGDLIYNSTIGAPQFYAGGNWYAFGSGASVINATTTSRGLGEVATVSDLSGATLTDSGAPLWIGTDVVIRSSTGAINNRNKVVATNNTGYLHPSLIGSGLPGTSSGEYLATGAGFSSTGTVLGSFTQTVTGAVVPTLALNLRDSGDVTLATTTFTAVDPTNLSGSLTVAKGDLLMMNLHAEYSDGPSTACNKAQFDISIRDGSGNPESVTAGTGFPEADCLANDNIYTATLFFTSATGGTLSIGMHARSADGNNLVVRSGGGATRLQVIKFPQ